MKRLFWRIYIYFGAALVVLSVFIGLIYTKLNRGNIVEVYQEQLNVLAANIGEQIRDYVAEDDADGFFSYLTALEDFGEMQNTDIWIMSKSDSKYGMSSDFTNIELENVKLPEKTNTLIDNAYLGKAESYSDFDTIYEKTMIHLASPVVNNGGKIMGVILLNTTVEGQEKTISQYQKYLIISIAIALIASALIVTFFTRQIVHPISKMKRLALELAKGDYVKKTDILRKDEIGDLAKSLDVLSDKLKEAEEMRDNLEQSRRDFFSNVSHELRTPITVLKGYAETLADGYVIEPQKQQEYFSRIVRECSSMERLVSDLLILSKIQNPDFELDFEVINVIAIMQDVLRGMRVMLSEHKMAVSLDYENEMSFALCDYDRIRQLFMVLIQNSVKYSEDGSSIEVYIAKEEGQIVIMITDHGIGIAEEQKEEIFEKFYRGSNHSVKDGSGLGLVVAKGIVERHGGSISVISTLGEGSCFLVRLPEAAPPKM